MFMYDQNISRWVDLKCLREFMVEFHEIKERKENFMLKILNLVNMRDLHFQVQFSQISCKKKVTVCEVLHCKSS